jgi:hypothetical protein
MSPQDVKLVNASNPSNCIKLEASTLLQRNIKGFIDPSRRCSDKTIGFVVTNAFEMACAASNLTDFYREKLLSSILNNDTLHLHCHQQQHRDKLLDLLVEQRYLVPNFQPTK